MYFQRIGELAPTTTIFFRTLLTSTESKKTSYFFFGSTYANVQLFKMFKRQAPKGVHIYDSAIGTRLIFALRPIIKRTRFWEAMKTDYTGYKLFSKKVHTLEFTADEEALGQEALHKMGISKDDWFVCFHARDGSYLRKWRPGLNEAWAKNDWRNNDVSTYFDALDFITERGGYALRIGATVSDPLPATRDAKIIDYASEYRSDFMDIYLSAKCRFFLGTASGPAWVPTVFHVPVVVIDHAPYSHSRQPGSIIIPRPIAEHDTAKTVPFHEAQNAGFYVASRTSSPGTATNLYLYGWGQSDAIDVLDACKDMFDQLDGTAVDSDGKWLQEHYADTYLSHLPDYQLAAKIGARWAKRHRHLIVEPEEPLPRD